VARQAARTRLDMMAKVGPELGYVWRNILLVDHNRVPVLSEPLLAWQIGNNRQDRAQVALHNIV
jgi:hypothetical protein